MGRPALDAHLRIDWIDAALLGEGLPGRLGLTSLPGKRGASLRYPGRVYRRELGRDLRTLRDSGVRRLVLLVEDHELERWGDRDIEARAVAYAVEVRRVPIPDGLPPSAPGAMDEILKLVRDGREVGDVAVACMGGVGRAGTVAACALVAAGKPAAAAIGLVRAVRHPLAVETLEQEAFVTAYAMHRHG